MATTLLPVIAIACGGAAERSGKRDSDANAGGNNSTGEAGAGGDSGGAYGHGGSSGVGGGTGGTGGSEPSGTSSVGLEGTPIYTRVQRLTVSQWKNAVTDILRLESAGELGDDFQPPVPVGEFTNNERGLYVDDERALDFERGSEEAAALATGSAEALSRLYDGTDASGFVAALGRRAFRRPLKTDEQETYEAVFALGEQLYGPGFANGAALVIRAMLVSPYFLYRTELGPAGEPLNGYEVASKLSFWLLGTTPSDSLLDKAAEGDLDSVDELESVAREMLERPEAAAVMRDFHAQAYRLVRYAAVEKPNVPEYDPKATAELAEASALFFDSVFTRGEGLREILTSSRAFIGPGLASLYGVDPPAAIEERKLDSTRVGYFMQVPFLTLFSPSEQPGTIGRGIALNSEALCSQLPPAPSDSPPIPAPPSGQTNRERIEEVTAGCGGACHTVFIDPLGFAFEAFDGLGRHRTRDNGQPVDTAASYPFAEGERAFADARELMQILAETTQAHTCYSKKVTGYALQRDLVEDDRALLEELASVSREESLKETIVALVRHPAFRLRAEDMP